MCRITYKHAIRNQNIVPDDKTIDTGKRAEAPNVRVRSDGQLWALADIIIDCDTKPAIVIEMDAVTNGDILGMLYLNPDQALFLHPYF